MNIVTWYKGVVLHGDATGRSIGFPTVNLDPEIIPQMNHGVYGCKFRYKEDVYDGALYYGPRIIKGEHNIILEIHVVGFDEEIYGKGVEFRIGNFVRPEMNFKTVEELQAQIENDLQIIAPF